MRYLRIGETDTTQSIYTTFPLKLGYFDVAAKALVTDLRPGGSVLLVGVAGATVARRIKMLRPDARIFGVDNDSLMVELGYKYFDTAVLENVWIEDAEKWFDAHALTFDRIMVDIYTDGTENEAIKSRTLKSKVLAHLTPDGRAYENAWTKANGNSVLMIV